MNRTKGHRREEKKKTESAQHDAVTKPEQGASARGLVLAHKNAKEDIL